MKRILRLLLVLVLVATQAPAQNEGIGIGQWRTHLPNYNGKAVAEVGSRIYCATEHGLFYFDREFNSVVQLTKVDGLSDASISTMAYDAQTQTLVVAYQNTNIDLIKDGAVTNINEILRTPIAGAKTINHIYFRNRTAYLSCSFGVVALDLVKLEIKDTYRSIGPGGKVLNVHASTSLQDSFFIATSDGVFAAHFNRNLLDFNNWRFVDTSTVLPGPTAAHVYRTIAAFNGKIYVGIDHQDVYRYDSDGWKALGESGSSYYNLTLSRDKLIISKRFNLVQLTAGGTATVIDHDLVASPRAAIHGTDDSYWIADYENGLVRVRNGQAQRFFPNGPFNSSVFSLYSDNKSVFLLSGGYADGGVYQFGNAGGFDEFRNGEWRNYSSLGIRDRNQFPEIRDLVDAKRNPVNGKLYVAAYGYGLLEWSGPGNFKIYNSANSTLVSAITGEPNYTRITAVDIDKAGNVWVANRNQPSPVPGLHRLDLNGNWTAFQIPNLLQGSNVMGLVIDDNGYKWMRVSRHSSGNVAGGGMIVYDDKNNRHKFLTENLPDRVVLAMEKDLRGDIWVGTAKGIAVFANTANAFRSDIYGPRTPIINRRPLLEGQVVRAIAVDGGNRKWVGTDAGVWLFNEDGDEAILNFTTKNSPLLSDKITDIAINNETGEVFIGTEAGLISYRGTATVTEGTPDCAAVFPNPVRPNFTGMVGISGLPNNAQVKITDVSGRLVYEMKAEGGTAAWNLADYNGKRVKAGVYVVLSANNDGSQHCISKIAVLD